MWTCDRKATEGDGGDRGEKGRRKRGKGQRRRERGTVVCVGFIEAKTNKGVEFVRAEKG
jgi:hypothetical protein